MCTIALFLGRLFLRYFVLLALVYFPMAIFIADPFFAGPVMGGVFAMILIIVVGLRTLAEFTLGLTVDEFESCTGLPNVNYCRQRGCVHVHANSGRIALVLRFPESTLVNGPVTHRWDSHPANCSQMATDEGTVRIQRL